MLTADEVELFRQEGALGPFDLESHGANAMARVLQQLESDVLATQSTWTNTVNQGRHLDSRLIYDLCTAPSIVDRVASILGNDLLLWQSNIFVKTPADKAFPWHQDANFWAMEPKVNVSAWLALTESSIENGCVQIIPGSHRWLLPHTQTPAGEFDVRFGDQSADDQFVDTSAARMMPLRPGQFFLFNERTLHRSAQNRTNANRIGLTCRFTVPLVKTYANQPVIVVRGRDDLNFNEVSTAPV